MRRHTGPVNIYLYAVGLGTILCGVAAVALTVGDTHFATLTTLLLIIGYTTSLLFRRLRYSARIIELAVVAGALVLYGHIISGSGIMDVLIPPAAAITPELRLACLLLWLEVLRSFTLISDEAVIFSAVPAIVLISLATTNNVNADILATFVVYLVLTSLLLAHRPGTERTRIRPQLRLAIAVTAIALVIGTIAMIPIRLGCTYAFAGAMPGFSHIRSQMSPLYSLIDPNQVQIAQGPVHLSEEVVMTVRSQEVGSNRAASDYWRGRVYDTYTGRGWMSRADTYRRVEPQYLEGSYHPYRYEGPAKHPVEGMIEQRVVTIVTPRRAVYAAAEPVILEADNDGIRRNADNCWSGLVPKRAGILAYRVFSVPPVSDPQLLRRAGTDYPDDVRRRFLQLTTSTPRVRALAEKVTQNFKSPYDKAAAIEQYLGSEYGYDTNTPAVPAGADVVEHFLFVSHTGYCEVFASAMVIMCREIGIPARYVTGFSTGVYQASDEIFNVREMDRHAWVEVYFPQYGWVKFDPTAASQGQNLSQFQSFVRSIRNWFSGILNTSDTVLIVTVLLTLLALAAFGPELRRLFYPHTSSAPSKLHEMAVKRYLAIQRSLKAMEPYLTPLEAAAKATSANAASTATEAANLFQKLRYGHHEISKEDIRELNRLHALLRSELARTQYRQ